MRRVRDDDVRLRHFLHHACHCHLPLLLPDLPLDLRIALGLLHLILDFLFRHLEILRRLPVLVAVVCDRHDHDHADDDERHLEDDLGDKRKTRRQVKEHELRHCNDLLVDEAVEEKSYDEDLKKGLRQLHEGAF